jgi:alpha-glucosidase
MKTNKHLLAIAVILSLLISCNHEDLMTLESPEGDIRVSMIVSSEGKAAYSLFLNEVPVIENSSLGILRDDGDYFAGLVFDSASEILTIRDDYSLLYGKKKEARYTANRRVFHLSNR